MLSDYTDSTHNTFLTLKYKTIMNDSNSMKTLLAFVGGIAAGAIVGVLMAPDKGSETRKKIMSGAKGLTDDLSDAAKDKYNEFLSWKDSLLDGAAEGVKGTVNKYADKANQYVDKADSKIKNA
jgi:gas vesicle protein